MTLWTVVCVGAVLGSGLAGADSGATAIHFRFEEGQPGAPVVSARDETGRFVAKAGQPAPRFSAEVPMAVLPGLGVANHRSLDMAGGWLTVPSCPELNVNRDFTVELWAKFGPVTPDAQVLASKGVQGPGNWHLIYQTDGTVRANIYGATQVFLFDPESGGPVPGVWYHIAASYQARGDGRMTVRGYVNGLARDAVTGPMLQDTSGTDLFIGSYPGGSLPFRGMMDEFRFTPRVLRPAELLTAGSRPVPESGTALAPMMVPAGTRITAALRAEAKGRPILAQPRGYRYYYSVATAGSVARCQPPPPGYDPAFATMRTGSAVNQGGSYAGYHFAVPKGGRFLVAVGFWDPATKPGARRQHVVMDGLRVDTLDAAAEGHGAPIMRLYRARDRNRDGFLEVSCCHADEVSATVGAMNVVWVFPADAAGKVTAEGLARGEAPVPALYYVACGREEKLKGHVGYPALSAQQRAAVLPPRPVLFGRDPSWPQPADPLNVEVRGELADRIRTYMDRWGYAGRDQRLVAGYLSDCGFETHGRFLDTFSKLSRLMKVDFDLRPPFEALLRRQDSWSRFPGSFIGGSPVRTGFIWGQGTCFNGLMAYYENTGDRRAIEAASRLSDWYESYLRNGDLGAANYFAERGQFSREGATVGHLGKGALEAMMWLYWRTRDPRHLARAKEMADLNRKWGGVSWMINGDIKDERPELESWHIHANLTTVRGFPWVYAATGDRSYLEDAIRACDRVSERATWGTGGVLEQIPWGRDPDPHDETCQTSDLLQLSFLLGDFTGEGRFFDRGEMIYWNHIRYMQYHQGDFSAFNRLPGPQRGGDAWFCCGWWGAKALYETACHLYASTRDAAIVNGFLPSTATLPVAGGTVRLEMQADIPRSGQVTLTVTPTGTERFALKVRVPGWAELRGVRVNGRPFAAEVSQGYACLSRRWAPGDRVTVDFELPLRVVLDKAWDTLPPARVAVGGKPAEEARCVSVFRGPVILAQFRLAHGCDLNWAYTGDHPDLFETLDSAVDILEADGWRFAAATAPELTTVEHTGDGIRLEWSYAPQPGWTLKRSALVRATVPVQVTQTAELVAPSEEAAHRLRMVRLCGVRMRTRGFTDYHAATLTVGGKVAEPGDAQLDGPGLAGAEAVLDNGYVQFRARSPGRRWASCDDGTSRQVYVMPASHSRTFNATLDLTITGQNQWMAMGAAAGS